MSTLRDLLQAAYRKINVIKQGSALDANMTTNGLYALDAMTDSWSNERLMIFSIKPYIFYTNPGQKDYTLGPTSDTPGAIQYFSLPFVDAGTGYTDGSYADVPLTGGTGSGAKANIVINEGAIINCTVSLPGINYLTTDELSVNAADVGGTGTDFAVNPGAVTVQTNWVIERPMKIEKAYVIWNDPNTSQAVDLPIALLTYEQYASVAVKNTSSTFAFSLYDDNAWPVRNITLFPIPQTQTGIRFWLRQPLVDPRIEMMDEPIDFPPGYERAFIYNLAIELAPEYGKTLTQEIIKTAYDSKEQLKRQNQSPIFRTGDGALSSDRGGSSWNYITGNFNSGGGGGFWGWG